MGDRGKSKGKAGLSITHALGYTKADFEANSHGVIGENQRAVLRKRSIRYSGFFVLVFIPFSAYFAGYYNYGNAINRLDIILFFSALAFLMFIAAKVVWNTQRELRSNKVGMIQGRVNLRFVRRQLTFGLTNRLEMQVGDLTFPVNKSVFTTFKSDEPYQVYYAPHSKMLLGAEWLREDDPFLPVQEDDEDPLIFDDENSEYYNQTSPSK